MDRTLKNHTDILRKNKEEIILCNIAGTLVEEEKIAKWQNWRSSDLSYKGELGGAIDDCLLTTEDGKYMVLDFKTKGTAFKSNSDGVDYVKKYYQMQMDCYDLILNSSGFETNHKAILLFFFPEEYRGKGDFLFKTETILIDVFPNNAIKILKEAQECLAGKIPKESNNCEYCNFIKLRKE
jgi:hypothetical protein